MNTEVLKKAIRLIGYWESGDSTVIKEILNTNNNLKKNIFEPFKKELNENLLAKETREGKRDLIKYYIFEFHFLLSFFEVRKEILTTGSLQNYTSVKYEHTNELGKKRKLDEYENYVVNCQIVFDILFGEIQLCCIKYKIDFYEICDELDFSIEFLDSGITFFFEEKGREKSISQQNGPDTVGSKVHNQISFKSIFGNNEAKISIIQEAMKALCIVQSSSERVITGFIDGCKAANALPEINNTDIMKAIYFELGKPLKETTKPRYDKKPYTNSLNKTKTHFGI